MGVIQPVIPKFPGDCCGDGELCLLTFGVCEQCLLNLRTPRCRAVLFQRSRDVPSIAKGDVAGTGCCGRHKAVWPARGDVADTGWSGQHTVVWPCRQGCPRVSPLGRAADALPPALAALLPWRLRALLLGSWSILACTLQCHEMLNFPHSHLPSVISQIWLLWLLSHFIQLHCCDFLVLTL